VLSLAPELAAVHSVTMRMTRWIALVTLFLLGGSDLFAQFLDRGAVFLETREVTLAGQESGDLWVSPGGSWAVSFGFILIDQAVPLFGPGRFLMPRPDQVIFHYDGTMAVWNGQTRRASDPQRAWSDIFKSTAMLGEIVPMRSGHFLVAEVSNDSFVPPALIEFSLAGIVASHPLPLTIDQATLRSVGPRHIELLSDQCTVLYSFGNDPDRGRRIGRFDLCRDAALEDFAMLREDESAGAIRELPDGSILVAGRSGVIVFTRDGGRIAHHLVPGASHLALSPDGTTVWVAGVDEGEEYLRALDVRSGALTTVALQFGSRAAVLERQIDDLAVVGEWRASSPRTARNRAVGRR
jgi:hypothetical protein